MLQLYNTLTRKIEGFKPLNPPNVGFYSCGPTVYDYAHIGHARTYIFADILYRTLLFHDFKVKRVMNITDVGHLTSDADSGEDKMEKGARREKKTVWEIADFYTKDFFDMLNKLNILKPDIICKATDYISQMIDLIKKLEEKGFTYKLVDGIYFDTAKFAQYGKLTGNTLNELQKSLQAGIRVGVVKGKKNITDFSLWKFSPKGEKRQMEWTSPWGIGFPGWHIECSAMSIANLGQTFDIHTGGVDHISIHHTNEIAQSEALTDKLFVKYWLHGEHLLVEGAKMSKSLHNFYRVADLEDKGFNPLSLRYLFLTAHYRTQLNFTWKALDASQNAYKELSSQIKTITEEIKANIRNNISDEKLGKVDEFRQKFTNAIDNDLNTPVALSVLWQVIKSNLPPADKFDLIRLFDDIFGLNLTKVPETEELKMSQEVKNLAKQREESRKQKNFEKADYYRKQIEEKGFIVQDTPFGQLIKPKQ